jgi:hypothetical protein
MFWTLELASYLEDAPWPATKDELIDYSIRSGALLRLLKICRNWKMKGKFTKALKTSGLTILHRKTFFLTKTNIDAWFT